MCRHQACIYPSNDVSSAVTVAKATGVIQEQTNKQRIQLQATTQRDPAVSAKLSVCIGMLGPGLQPCVFRWPGRWDPCLNSKAHVSELVSWTTNLSFVFFPGAQPHRQAAWIAHQPGKAGKHLRDCDVVVALREREWETTDRACLSLYVLAMSNKHKDSRNSRVLLWEIVNLKFQFPCQL
jgi:hypothetical protein